MKRFTKISLICLSCALTFGAGAFAATSVPRIFVNGNQVTSDAQPRIIDGTVYVPIRAISDGFGTSINWDNDTKTVYVNSDPDAKQEPDPLTWVSYKNLISEFIMAYDERRYEDFSKTINKDFKTDIYAEFPTGGVDRSGIIDYKIIAYDGAYKFTVQVIRRLHPALDERHIKVENWELKFQNNRIVSAMIVPKSTKYLDQYTIVPNVTFGVGSY